MHPGQGPGLSTLHDLGEMGGSDTVSLLESEIPSHTHSLQTYAGRGTNVKIPTSAVVLADSQGNAVYDATASPPVTPMSLSMISPAGGSAPHNNMMPYLTLNFCIALQGVYPPRS